MRSSFPGMDPYLESPEHWSDFHGQFLVNWCVALNEVLPVRYRACLDERIPLACPDEKTRRIRIVQGADRSLVTVLEWLSPFHKSSPAAAIIWPIAANGFGCRST